MHSRTFKLRLFKNISIRVLNPLLNLNQTELEVTPTLKHSNKLICSTSSLMRGGGGGGGGRAREGGFLGLFPPPPPSPWGATKGGTNTTTKNQDKKKGSKLPLTRRGNALVFSAASPRSF